MANRYNGGSQANKQTKTQPKWKENANNEKFDLASLRTKKNEKPNTLQGSEKYSTH